MKLITVIKQMEKLRARYKKNYGIEPHVFDFDLAERDHLTVELCRKVQRVLGGTSGKKPCMEGLVRFHKTRTE